MSVSLMYALVEMTVATSVAILVVALTRKPLRRIAGAQVTYWLWLLVPASAVVVSLPGPSQFRDTTAQILPQIALGAFPAAMPLGDSVGAADVYATMGLIVWSSGSLLMLALMLRRQHNFTRSLGDMISLQDGTHRSMAVRGPVLVGVWCPRIVLPADFEAVYGPEERSLVLAHEQAHQQRGDLMINAVATIWLCLSWFNPLMYWAVARFKFDQELACDAVVLAELGTGRRRYADALLKTQLVADSAWRTPVRCHWQSSHPLKERIAMLKRPLPGLLRRLSGAALVSVLIISGSYAVWTIQPTPAYAEELQQQNFLTRISADRVSTLPNGDVEYSGNVVVIGMPDDPPLSFDSDSAYPLPEGGLVLEGAVRILSEGDDRVLTTVRAILENGTIRMDSARVARSSQPH